jgi:ABC-type Fe3+-siderophore transport system permease subunit
MTEKKDGILMESFYLIGGLAIIAVIGCLIAFAEHLWSTTAISLIGIPIIIWLSHREKKEVKEMEGRKRIRRKI